MLTQTKEIISKLILEYSDDSENSDDYRALQTQESGLQTSYNNRLYKSLENSIRDTQSYNAFKKLFKKSNSKIKNMEVSDSNYSELDGMKEFVTKIGEISIDDLVKLTLKMIDYENAAISNKELFMRDTTLAKVLLGFIWEKDSSKANSLIQHINEKVFNSEKAKIDYFDDRFLRPMKAFFNKTEEYFQNVENALTGAENALSKEGILLQRLVIAEGGLASAKHDLTNVADMINSTSTQRKEEYTQREQKINQRIKELEAGITTLKSKKEDQASSDNNQQSQENTFTSFCNKFKPFREKRDQQLESDYMQGLENLKGTLQNYTDTNASPEIKIKQEDVKNKALNVVKQIEALKESGQESTTVLSNVLKNTQDLVNGVKDGNKANKTTEVVNPYEYQAEAQRIQRKHSVSSQVLGGMMIALGAAVIALSIASAAVLNIGAVVGVAVGAYIAAQGIGFFQRGKEQYGLSKAMNDLAKTQEEVCPLIEDEQESSEDGYDNVSERPSM
jgi:predicted transposase YbfD/YdcC